MRKSLIALAVLSTFVSYSAIAEEEAAAPAAPAAAAEPESPWTVTTNFGFVSDYYFRGISQNWHKPAAQGGIDITHSSGFYVGTWASNVTPNTYPDASVEIDIYGGYNGSISAVEGLGWTAGLYGYVYPGGGWNKYNYLGVPNQTPDGGRWDTLEANFGASYKWISAKVSVTLTDWFGAGKDTGWKDDTKGSTYIELNAAYPLPWGEGWTLVGHIGRLNVSSSLNTAYSPGLDANGNQILPSATTESTSPDYTDWKIGVSKAFSIAKAEGFSAGLYWIDSNNDSYWSDRGYGGSSFNGSSEAKNLSDGRFVLTLGRTF